MGKQWKQWQTLFFGLQNHCRWWMQSWNWMTLAPWKKRYDQPRQHIKKESHYFANKVHLIKAMVFPVVMYGCESWTIKKAEPWQIDVFELWCWRGLLRVPWTARWSNQSFLKEIRCWNSSTLATWCKELIHWKRPWCWERSKAWGEGDDRGWDGWMALPTQWTWVYLSSRIWWWTGKPGGLQSMGVAKSWRRLSHWTDLIWTVMVFCKPITGYYTLYAFYFMNFLTDTDFWKGKFH